MIVTSYTRLVLDCHREELANRFHLGTNGYFAISPASPLPESYRVPPERLMQPLPVGREALELNRSEIVSTV